MRLAGRGVVFVALVLVSSLFAWTATSNSAGAPQNSADGGCTCHNAQPDTTVQVGLQGFPEAYVANTTYDISITVTGGPVPVPAVSQNQGGFALKVSGGLLLADDGITVTGGTFATHSASTNNQRSWALQWVAPETSSGPVTATVSVNSVNGDGVNAGGLDRWNKATVTVAPAGGGAASTNGTQAAGTTSEGSTASLPVVVVGVLLVAVAVFARRRV